MKFQSVTVILGYCGPWWSVSLCTTDSSATTWRRILSPFSHLDIDIVMSIIILHKYVEQIIFKCLRILCVINSQCLCSYAVWDCVTDNMIPAPIISSIIYIYIYYYHYMLYIYKFVNRRCRSHEKITSTVNLSSSSSITSTNPYIHLMALCTLLPWLLLLLKAVYMVTIATTVIIILQAHQVCLSVWVSVSLSVCVSVCPSNSGAAPPPTYTAYIIIRCD